MSSRPSTASGETPKRDRPKGSIKERWAEIQQRSQKKLDEKLAALYATEVEPETVTSVKGTNAMSATHNVKLTVESRPLPLPISETRSPSRIPDRSPLPPAHPPQTSLRIATVPSLSSVTYLPQGGPDEAMEDGFINEDTPALSVNEYIIPVAMIGSQQAHYQRSIQYKRELIEVFTAKRWSTNSPIVAEANEFLVKLNNIATHLDIDNPSAATSEDAPPVHQAKWGEGMGKFLFLTHFFKALRQQDIHIIVMAKPGRTLDVLERFLLGKDISYARPDSLRSSQSQSTQDLLSVTILPTAGEESSAITKDAAAIIALDQSFEINSRKVQSLRKHGTIVDQLIPVYRPVVMYSAEHAMMCKLPERSMKDNVAKLSVVISCAAQLRQEAGKLPLDYPGAEQSATIAARLLIDGYGTWYIPSIGGITHKVDLSVPSPDSQFSPMSSSLSMGTQEHGSAQKRLRDAEEAESTKRTRLTPQPGTREGNDVSITRISDTVLGSQPSKAATSNATSSSSTPQSVVPQELARIRTALKEAEKRSTEAEKRANTAETSLLEHIRQMEQLQFRYEERANDIKKANTEKREALSFNDVLRQREERKSELLAKAKQETADVKEKLKAANEALLSSQAPGQAEFTALKVRTEVAEKGMKKAEDRLKSTQNELEYIRTQYQTASSAASELASTKTELMAKLQQAEKLAAGEASKVRQLSNDGWRDQYLRKIRELEGMLKSREDLCRKLSEDVRRAQLARQGVGTRQTSVPRSPRVSGGGVGVAFGGNGGVGSRQGSPLPGMSRVDRLRGE
ncbi:hypothetical protein M501DRAFT_533738 [Patellaria atrata CBS 101060]|uniref:HDA1 complex subunit n=1 Tax=Patellaria atrata CBS 101060 TaxID=1346257 RepID=A0A9P4SGQ1_9PEZI|nr:hypothetical protein M501DRAFT_533738 [Patellaria atrata CBS 101060]